MSHECVNEGFAFITDIVLGDNNGYTVFTQMNPREHA